MTNGLFWAADSRCRGLAGSGRAEVSYTAKVLATRSQERTSGNLLSIRGHQSGLGAKLHS